MTTQTIIMTTRLTEAQLTTKPSNPLQILRRKHNGLLDPRPPFSTDVWISVILDYILIDVHYYLVRSVPDTMHTLHPLSILILMQ